MHKPNFTKEQEYWIQDIIKNWYSIWIKNISSDGLEKRLCIANTILKKMISPNNCNDCHKNYVENFKIFLCYDCLKQILNNA